MNKNDMNKNTMTQLPLTPNFPPVTLFKKKILKYSTKNLLNCLFRIPCKRGHSMRMPVSLFKYLYFYKNINLIYSLNISNNRSSVICCLADKLSLLIARRINKFNTKGTRITQFVESIWKCIIVNTRIMQT